MNRTNGGYMHTHTRIPLAPKSSALRNKKRQFFSSVEFIHTRAHEGELNIY